MHLPAVPGLGEGDDHAPRAPRRAGAHRRGLQLGTVGRKVYLVVASALAAVAELHRVAPGLHLGELRRRHRAVAHHNVRPVHLHFHSKWRYRKAPFVEPHEQVALRHVLPQALMPQAHAQHHLQRPGQLHHLLEQLSVQLLLLRARIAHTPRPRPQAPLAAPLVPDDRPHRPTVGVVDSKSLFCHLLEF